MRPDANICSASAQKAELNVVGVLEVSRGKCASLYTGSSVWDGLVVVCTHSSFRACMHCIYWHGILEGTRAWLTTTAMAQALLRLKYLAPFLHREWSVRFFYARRKNKGCYVHAMYKMRLFWAKTGKTSAYFLRFDIKLKNSCSVFDLVTVLISKQSFFQHHVWPVYQGKSYLHGIALPDFYIVSPFFYKRSKQARIPTFVWLFRGIATTAKGPGCDEGTNLRWHDFAVIPLMLTRVGSSLNKNSVQQ